MGLKEKKVRFRSDSGIGIFQCLIGPSIVRGWDRVLSHRKGMGVCCEGPGQFSSSKGGHLAN